MARRPDEKHKPVRPMIAEASKQQATHQEVENVRAVGGKDGEEVDGIVWWKPKRARHGRDLKK